MPRLYWILRAVGWAAFGVYVIALGMACLFIQVISIGLIISATVIVLRQIGTNRKSVGNWLTIEIFNAGIKFRAAMYACLALTLKETDSMVLWNLFPHRSNEAWWAKYSAAKEEKGFVNWDRRLGEDWSTVMCMHLCKNIIVQQQSMGSVWSISGLCMMTYQNR